MRESLRFFKELLKWGVVTSKRDPVTGGIEFSGAGADLATVDPAAKTATSGAGYAHDISETVSPAGNSTQQYNLVRQLVSYNSNYNMAPGGWLSAGLSLVETAGSGTIDKVVAGQAQVNLTGGNVTAAVGSEAIIGAVGAATLVGNFVGHYFPNLSGVANIGNVQNIWAFSCDHYNSRSRNAGRWVKTVNPLGDSTVMQEVGPHHPGVVTGRYYFGIGARGALTPTALVAGVQYFIPFRVPERTTYTKIGVRVTTGVAASNARLGVFHAVNGLPTTLVVDSGDVSTAAAGAVEVTISQPLEAGVYFLCVFPSAAISVNFQEHSLFDLCGASTDNGGESALYAGPTAYGALPAAATGVAASAASNMLPAVWLRK